MTDTPDVQNPEVELHKPSVSEPIVTQRDSSAFQSARRGLNELLNQGWSNTFLEGSDRVRRLVTGAPNERFSRITPQLHVGGQYTRAGWDILTRRGVTATVDMRDESDGRSEDFMPPRCLRLPTVDHHAPTADQLEQGVRFIHDELTQGGQVYVHCREGLGRGPTMLAAYLVSTGLTPSEAWEKIRAVRPFIRPNVSQIEQIDQFAAKYGKSG